MGMVQGLYMGNDARAVHGDDVSEGYMCAGEMGPGPTNTRYSITVSLLVL